MKAELRFYQPTAAEAARGRVPATLHAKREDATAVYATGQCLAGIEKTRAVWGSTLGKRHVTLTSVVDGKHRARSGHYTGNAWDIRIRGLRRAEVDLAVERLKEVLGRDYFVYRHSTHIHAEWRPVGPAVDLGA